MPEQTHQSDDRLLSNREDLVAWLEEADRELDAKGPRRVALDTEADSFHSYKEKLSLLQIQAGSRAVLIDPLVIPHDDLEPLLRFLETTEVWFHGMDYDLSLFKRTFDWTPPDAKDTQVAAQLGGFRRFGLANLLDECFEIKLSKESQRADWGKRPLSETMIDYALNDVLHLLRLADHLVARLDSLDRTGWFLQSVEATKRTVLARPPKDPEDSWRIKGFGKLNRRGWAYLREIWFWREHEADLLDRPAFKVMPNGKIFFLIDRLLENKPAEPRGRYNQDQKARFAEAVERARNTDEKDLPKKRRLGGRRKPDDIEERVSKLKGPRDRVAKELDIDPSLIATRGRLEDIAMDGAEGWENLLPWQATLLRNAGVPVEIGG